MKRNWSLFELALLKATAMLVGVLAGIYFYDFLKNYTAYIWPLVVTGGLLLIFLFVRKLSKTN